MKILKTKLNYATSYALLDITSLRVGDVVPFDIFIRKENNFVLIIEAGTLLSDSLHSKLAKQSCLYVSKKDEKKQILSCETLKYYIIHNKDNMQKRVQLLYDVNSQLFDNYLNSKDNAIDINCVESIIKSVIYLIKCDENFIKNTMPYFINENMLKNHSLHVAVYALALGNALKLNEKELLELGTAALLHDVGFKKIDAAITERETSLSPQENKLVQRHPIYSVEIIKQNHIHDPYIIDAVIHHHERYDGTGYPEGRIKGEISSFASILAICDVFDALTNNRPHRKGYSSFDALKLMMLDSKMINGFNQEYLYIALRLL